MPVRRRRGGRSVRRARSLVVAGAALLLAAACASTAKAPTARILRVLMTDDWVTAPFVDAVRDFEREHPGVRIDVSKGPIAHMNDTVAAAVRNRSAPDVVQGHAFSAAAQELAEPVDDLWRRHLDPEEFLPGAVEDVEWAGRLYGVPLDTNALFLVYNADHFAAANLPPPDASTTFEDLEEAAAALSTPDGSRRAIAVPTSTWWTYGWIRANGGEVVEVGADRQATITLDAPAVVEAVDYLARLVRRGHAFPPRAADSSSRDALALFEAGSASIHATGSWDLAELARQASGSRYASTVMPKGAGGTAVGSAMGGSSLFVPMGSRHREVAFEFMVHLVSDRYALRFAKEEGRLPVRPRVYRDPFFQKPELQAVLEQLPSAHPFKLGAFPEPARLFAAAVDDVLRSGKDAGATLRDAQTRAVASLTRARHDGG